MNFSESQIQTTATIVTALIGVVATWLSRRAILAERRFQAEVDSGKRKSRRSDSDTEELRRLERLLREEADKREERLEARINELQLRVDNLTEALHQEKLKNARLEARLERSTPRPGFRPSTEDHDPGY